MAGRRLRLFLLAAGAALLLLQVGSASAREGKTGSVDARAMKIVERMSDFLARAQKFSVTIDMGYDVVQNWGQKLEFGETRVVTVRRPDHIRVDVKDRNGSTSGLVFDGKDISVFDLTYKVYATVAKPGSLDDAIGYFVDELGMRLPMAALLSEDLPKVVASWGPTVRYIEPSTIGGVDCDHLSLSGDWEDVQLWIARGDEPLPRRVVITYTRAEGKPQFWAALKDWNLSPRAPDSLFAFAPQKGAAKIAFAPLLQQQQPGAAQPRGDQP